MDWFLGLTTADVRSEYERKLALCRLADLAESSTLLYCFRKKERGRRWMSIEELPEKHRWIAECVRPENGKRFLDKFVDSGKFQYREDSDNDVEDSGWEDDEDGDLNDYGVGFQIPKSARFRFHKWPQQSSLILRPAPNTLGHRRAEDGKAEARLALTTVRQLEDQARETLELVKWWKEERLKMG